MPHLHSAPPGAGPSLWLGDDRMRRVPAPFPRELSLSTRRSELFHFDLCQDPPRSSMLLLQPVIIIVAALGRCLYTS